MKTPHTFAVFALGSRGDVLPLFILVRKVLLENGISKNVIIVTHAEHREILSNMLKTFSQMLMVHYIKSPVMSTDITDFESFNSKEYFRNFIETHLNHTWITLVITNLFALEGWILASTFGIQCIIVHPTKPTNDEMILLDDVILAMKTRRPHYFQVVAAQTAAQNDHPMDVKNSNDTTLVTWSDYTEWLWPTTSPDFDAVFLSLENDYRGPNCTIFRGRTDPATFAIPAPLVLLVISPELFSRPFDWPSHYRVCGSVVDQADTFIVSSQDNHPSSIEEHSTTSFESNINRHIKVMVASLESSDLLMSIMDGWSSTGGRGVVCVDMGSMTALLVAKHSLIDFAAAIIRMSFSATNSEGYRWVVVCHGHLEAFSRAMKEAVIGLASRDSTAGDHESTSRPSVLLVPHDVNHHLLLRRCVTVVHHGGVGTGSACMREGVSQVIIPIMYDQSAWAEKLAVLRLCPAPLSLDVMFPVLRGEHVGITRAAWSPDSLVANQTLVALKTALQASTAPQQRLRCGTAGRRLRDDPCEDGLLNAMYALRAVLSTLEEEDTENASNVEQNDRVNSSTRDSVLHGTQFDDGLSLHTHFCSAPEETLFLYEEVFAQGVYLRHGVSVEAGDLVVDIGANVGMFSVCVELLFLEPNALRLVVVEPVSCNFELLKKNMALYCPTAALFQVAVGGCEEEEVGQNNGPTAKMHCWSRFPGNSCLSQYAEANSSQRAAHMNPRVLASVDSEEVLLEDVRVMGLSAVLSEYFAANNCNVDQQRIKLLKIDVEGGELAVLRSLRPAHWSLIEQVVLEAALSLVDEVVALLVSHAYAVIVEESERLTGCCMVYATRNKQRLEVEPGESIFVRRCK